MTLHATLAFFVLPHVIAGSIALVLFWLAAAARKGSPFHRKVGQGYLLAMLVIVITGVPLVALTWLRGQPVTALFLGYLVLLVSLGCRNAFLSIRYRRQPERFAGANLWILALLTALAGVAVTGAGLYHQAWILVIFGLIGPLGLARALGRVRRQRQGVKLAPNWWLKEHYGAMIGNGVATHIAFFQIGLQRAFPGLDLGLVQPLAWFGPLLVAVLAAIWLGRRHDRPSTSGESAAPKLG